MTATQTYDVVVVGAGTAGCVAAGRLAEAGLSVAVIDAGPDLRTQPEQPWPEREAILDPARMHELWDSRVDWGYRTVPQEHAAGRRLHLPRGRVVGGSHALNAMIWVRGHSRDYDSWEAAGNPGWGWESIRPVFERLECPDPGAADRDGGQGLAHVGDTRDGPVDLLTDYAPMPLQMSIVEAAVAAGVPFNPDYNRGEPDGVSYVQYTIRDERRWMTADAFLSAPGATGSVTVLAGRLVDRLAIEGSRCTGVFWVSAEGGTESGLVMARHDVILSAGAFGSPTILQRSGIGPARDLRRRGVFVRLDAPAVGAGLVDHWLVPVVSTVEREVVAPQGLPPAQSHLFWRSTDDLPVPDLQPIHFAVPLVPEGEAPLERGFSLMAGLVQPTGRGTVMITDTSPESVPEIDPRVLESGDDLRALVASVRLCELIAGQTALTRDWGARQVYPAPGRSRPEIEDYVRRSVTTYHHAAGTCAMGPHGVLDERLRVRGIDGLRVADASVMPTIVSGNTNAPAAMIGWRAAQFVADDLAD